MGDREFREGSDCPGIVRTRPDDDGHPGCGLLEDRTGDRAPLGGRKVGDLAGDDRVEQAVDAGRESIGDASSEAVKIDPVVVFMVGTVLALLLNYPNASAQRERVDAHAKSCHATARHRAAQPECAAGSANISDRAT